MMLLKIIIVGLALGLCSCDQRGSTPVSNSGVGQATANVTVQSNGLSVEQENIKRRVEADNKPGSIKYLYMISPLSGDVIMSSTVHGKVTSGSKRLTPTSGGRWWADGRSGFEFAPGKYSNEMIQDDGTYGSSTEFIYWWDVNGVYNQVSAGGVMVVITDQPRNFKKVIINLDQKSQ